MFVSETSGIARLDVMWFRTYTNAGDRSHTYPNGILFSSVIMFIKLTCSSASNERSMLTHRMPNGPENIPSGSGVGKYLWDSFVLALSQRSFVHLPK